MKRDPSPLFAVARSAFAWFLVGCLTLVWFVPVLLGSAVLFVFDRDRKHIHPLISSWARAILTVCPLMRVRMAGAHHLKPGAVYVMVANHQSLADILALLHLKQPFKFIAKQELFWIPIFGWALWLAGYIPLVRGSQKSGKDAVEQAKGYLRRGCSVLFFPEGTRSSDGQIHPFKFGAFKIASEMEVPVVPIVIDGTRTLVPKGGWVMGRRVQVMAELGASQIPLGSSNGDIELFMNRVREGMISSLADLRTRLTVNAGSD